MNVITFRKGAQLENNVKKNKWVMHFWNMSGDADHYEEEKLELESTLKFLDYIMIYATHWLMNERDRYDNDKVLAAADAKGVELGMDPGDAHDLYSDLAGYDVQSDGQFLASPEECWITYFDEHGVEHQVEIVNDGKVFYKINESNIKEVLK